MKKTAILSLISVILSLLVSCQSKSEISTLSLIASAKESLKDISPHLTIYSSLSEPHEQTYLDTGLVFAMLGDSEDIKKKLSVAREYSILLSAEMRVCEVWVIQCYTYDGAKQLAEIFKKRAKMLSGHVYENDDDTAVTSKAKIKIHGKYLIFAVSENSEDIIDDIINKI